MADVNSAVLRFETEHINRVLFLTAAGGDALFFMSQAQSQNYRPRYALASPDGPDFLAQNVASTGQLDGAMGVGWLPASDVHDTDSYPLDPAEKRCLAVHAKTGSTFATRNDAVTAFAFCDMMWLFEDVGNRVGRDLTRLAWAAALPRIGDRLSPYTFADRFSGAHADGAVGYRPMKYYGSCTCFRYTAALRRLS
jgi:hypothetical protein